MRCLQASLFSTAAGSVALRPYQQSCLDACHAALNAGVTRIGVSLPTGSGKTTVFTTLLSQIPSPKQSPGASRSLIIVNSVELARQAAAQAETTHSDWKVEIEQGTKHKATGLADVTVATYQTLLQPQRLAKFRPEDLKAIIIDEAHHAAAPSPPHPIPIIGFSATFSRHDGLALGSVFEKIVYHHGFLEMIKEQWLCDVRFTSVKANIDLQGVTVNSRTGDFNATSLAHIINTDTINNLVVRAWLDRASDRKSTLVFCVNIAHVLQLTKTFQDFGVEARYLHSGTPAPERRALISDFKAGSYPVLVNCAILTEGADIPNIDCVVVARPTRSRNVFAQMIGRGMRQSPGTGKVDCRVIDFVDSTSRVPGVVSVPTLFGLDPSEVIDARAESENSLNLEDITARSDSRFSGAPHISKLSSNAWVGCGNDIYILECLGKGYIRIEPIPEDEDNPAGFRATYTEATMHISSARQLKISPFMRKRLILTAQSLPDAVKGCDTYATQKVLRGPLALGLLRSAKWRQAPATDSQKDLVNKRRGKRAMDQEQIAEVTEKLSKGEAANIITRLKHGAHSYHEKKLKRERKEQQIAQNERLRIARETVRVGPLNQL
ncbi:P-loop containing nucleoside triphosphate hydrolase protein [Melanogaster broomeanus]|nr:P-loop containing nucleoside triphosphate hydrolase protein [Melanogaster broomeanus]